MKWILLKIFRAYGNEKKGNFHEGIREESKREHPLGVWNFT